MKKILRLCLFALPALLPYPARAQQDFWEPCGGPITGQVNALAVHPDGHLFAGSSRAGVYRLPGGGENWGQVYGSGPGSNVYAMALNSQGHVFAVRSGSPGIIRSLDDGASWVNLAGPWSSAQVFCLAINNQGHVFAGTSVGLFRSLDNGNSWGHLNNGLASLEILALSINTLGHLFACMKVGVFRSTDNGTTWDDLDLNTPSNVCATGSNGLVWAAADSSLYRSADNGDSWEPLDWPFGQIRSMAVSADGQLLTGSDTGLFQSGDAGSSWEPSGLIGLPVSALTFDAGNALFAGTDRGVFFSSDNGNTWSFTGKGLANTRVSDFAESPAGFLFASSWRIAGGRNSTILEGGVFRSSNEGNTWIPVTPSVFGGGTSFAAVHVTDLGHILVGGIYTSSSGSTPENFRSTDHGDTWEYVDIPGPVQDFVSNSQGQTFACSAGYGFDFGWAPGGIFTSLDDGLSWDSVFVNGSSFTALTINPEGNLFASTSHDSIKVIRSTDNGTTWTSASNGIPAFDFVNSLAADSQGHLFAGLEYGGVYRSENNGDSWNSLGLELNGERVSGLAVNASDHIFAATTVGVWYSTDHGASWDSLNAGLTNPSVNALFFSKNGRLFAGTQGSGVFRSVEPVSAVKEVPGKIISVDALGQIYPNPLRIQASIPFSIAAPGRVRLAVYDMTGRERLVAFDADFQPGNYEAAFRPGDLPAGVYFYSLDTQRQRLTKKLLVVR